MLGLPKSTEFNKRIPKNKFYENMNIPTSLRKVFVDKVKGIYWRNKIASSTVNIAEGNLVSEIEIIEVRINNPKIDQGLIQQIDREIPYHILFLIEHGGKYQAWIAHKEANKTGTKAFKINAYYHTDWFEEGEIKINLKGLDMDAVYENMVRQIAGEKLNQRTTDESLEESIDRDQKKQRIEKEISALKAKIRKEKQFNKQVEMNNEVKKLRKELKML